MACYGDPAEQIMDGEVNIEQILLQLEQVGHGTLENVFSKFVVRLTFKPCDWLRQAMKVIFVASHWYKSLHSPNLY